MAALGADEDVFCAKAGKQLMPNAMRQGRLREQVRSLTKVDFRMAKR